MKHLILILTLLFQFTANAQTIAEELPRFWLYGKVVVENDVIPFNEYKNIEVRPAGYEGFDVQFWVQKYDNNVLSFRQKVSEMHTLDFSGVLAMAEIKEEEVVGIRLFLNKGEGSSNFAQVVVYPRELKTGADYFNAFKACAGVGRGDDAKYYIEEALKIEPGNMEFLNARAQLFYEMGDYESAIAAFEANNKVRPNHASYYYLAVIHQLKLDLGKAENYYAKALELAADKQSLTNVLVQQAEIQKMKGKFEEAYGLYKQALDHTPNDIAALNNITTVLDEVGRKSEKIMYFERMAKVNPDFYQIHVNIGFAYLEEEKYEEAIREFGLVLNKEPNQPNALNNTGYALYKLKNYPEALEFVNKSIHAMPSNSYAYRNRALIYLEMKDKKAACEDLEKAIELGFTTQYGDEVKELKKKHCK